MSAPSEPVKVSLGRPELLTFAYSEVAFIDVDCSRISSILLAQLLQLHASRTINISNVTAEIMAMEGVGPRRRTGGEEVFKVDSILEGLHKKHFIDARFIVKNISSEYGFEKDGNDKLDKLIGKLFHEHKGQYVTEGFDRSIAHELTIGAMKHRAGRGVRGDLTGEWIIFKKHKGKRFYLCLAAHTETNEQILARVKNAIAMDFQFLEARV